MQTTSFRTGAKSTGRQTLQWPVADIISHPAVHTTKAAGQHLRLGPRREEAKTPTNQGRRTLGKPASPVTQRATSREHAASLPSCRTPAAPEPHSKYPTPSGQPIMGTEQSSQIWPATKEPTLKRQRHRNTAGVAMRILHPRMRNHQQPRPAAFGTTVPGKQWGLYPAPQRHGRLGMKTMCPSPPDAGNPPRERQPLRCIALQARSEASRR